MGLFFPLLLLFSFLWAGFAVGMEETEPTTQRHFFRKSLPSEVWHRYVERTAPGEVASRAECSGYCQAANGDDCDIFIIEGATCYLGRYGGSFSHIPDQGFTADAYLDTEVDLTAAYHKLADVASPDLWATEVSVAADLGPDSAPADCMALCEEEVDFACDIFVMEDTKCHYGQAGVSGGDPAALENPEGPWTVYIKQTSFGGIHDPKITTLASRSMEETTPFVYRAPAGPISAEECGLQCVYSAEPEPCHFYFYEGGECKIGSFLTNGTSVGGADVHVKLQHGVLSSYYEARHDTVGPSVFGQYIYASMDIPFTRWACAALCLTEEHPPGCHFTVLHGSICNLGSFTYIGESAASVATGSAEVLLDGVVDPDYVGSSYLEVKVNMAAVYKRFSSSGKTATSESHCAAFCDLLDTDEDCTMFYFNDTLDECWLGYVGNANPATNLVSISEASVFVKNAANERWFGPLFEKSTAVSGDKWVRKIYKKVTMESGSSSAQDECQALCYLDGGPCYIYVVDGSSCYLGAHHVDTDSGIDASMAKDVYQRKATVGLFHGGYEDFPEPRFNDFNAFTEEQSYCPNQHGIPSVPHAKHAHALVFTDPYLMFCGGYHKSGPDSYPKGKWCKIMDLSAPKREWVETAPMINARIHFPLVVLDGDPDHVYAIGGESDAGCISAIEKYTVSTDTWVGVGDLTDQVGRVHACAVALNDEIWHIGGKGTIECDILMDKVEIWTPSTNTWRNGSPFPMNIFHAYCGTVKSTSDDHDWILVGGGYDNGWHNQLRYYDATANTGWNTLPDLPLHMGWNGYTNSIIVMSRLEMYIIGADSNENGKGKNNVMVWNDREKKFRTTGRMVPSQIRQWPGVAVVPMKHMWNCMPRSDEWELVLSQDSNEALFGDNDWNSDDPGALSKLDQIENYWSCEGKYHFRLVYPELGHFNEWYQTSNPRVSNAVAGYQALAVKYDRNFIGLRLDNGAAGLLSGAIVSNPVAFTVGAKEYFVDPDKTFRGPEGPSGMIPVTRLKLYVKKDC